MEGGVGVSAACLGGRAELVGAAPPEQAVQPPLPALTPYFLLGSPCHFTVSFSEEEGDCLGRGCGGGSQGGLRPRPRGASPGLVGPCSEELWDIAGCSGPPSAVLMLLLAFVLGVRIWA